MLEASRIAKESGFDDASCQSIATVVSELARNIVKYAGTGQLIIRPLQKGRLIGIEIEAQDRGPGIEDVRRVMKDGFSSGGTLGLGLPSVRRLMDDFKIESRSGGGTSVVARKWRRQ